MVKELLRRIESRRGSNRILPRLAVGIKDTVWYVLCFFPARAGRAMALAYSKAIVYPLSKLAVACAVRRTEPEYKKVSFCITCMGRLSHLKQTLEKNILDNARYPNVEFVLLVYYRTLRPEHFHVTRAKNIVHSLATGDILCNLDADNFTGKDLAFYLNRIFNKKPNTIVGVTSEVPDCFGRIALTRRDFNRLGGYDESFEGWGFEDDDIIVRAEEAGLSLKLLPAPFLKYIPHSDLLRERNTRTTLEESMERNYLRFESRLKGQIKAENPPIAPDEVSRLQ